MKVKTCACGWKFLTIGDNDIELCPQCRVKTKYSFCECCGKENKHYHNKRKRCDKCSAITKYIYNREDYLLKKLPIKNIVDNEMLLSDHLFTTLLCNQDCENCKHPDCILPE